MFSPRSGSSTLLATRERRPRRATSLLSRAFLVGGITVTEALLVNGCPHEVYDDDLGKSALRLLLLYVCIVGKGSTAGTPRLAQTKSTGM